eukprot:c4370_g1_i1.p1 GENE.c4370_g1_i1~~c4370_g1_i1.p1  ORF type:complete len:245 (-),score=50.33 c4370_g1_i1:49-750(-)
MPCQVLLAGLLLLISTPPPTEFNESTPSFPTSCYTLHTHPMLQLAMKLHSASFLSPFLHIPAEPNSLVSVHFPAVMPFQQNLIQLTTATPTASEVSCFAFAVLCLGDLITGIGLFVAWIRLWWEVMRACRDCGSGQNIPLTPVTVTKSRQYLLPSGHLVDVELPSNIHEGDIIYIADRLASECGGTCDPNFRSEWIRSQLALLAAYVFKLSSYITSQFCENSITKTAATHLFP